MKYERGQFGERWHADTVRGLLIDEYGNHIADWLTNLSDPTSPQRAVACVNALDGLDPDVVPELAAWWTKQQFMSNWQPHPELTRLLDKLIGADDAE